MLGELFSFPWLLFTDWKYYRVLAAMVFVGEAILTAAVIWKIGYTEIDWKAYMEEVGGFLGGEMDYAKLKGGTGPLVYPAGFVWVYSALYWLTNGGSNIVLAQWVFWGLYVGLVGVVLVIYGIVRPGRSPWPVVLLAVSKRVHSLFVLRLFNDGIAMLLLYIAVLFFLRYRWRIGCVFFSLAVSVKMNILLFAPGLLLLLLRNTSLLETVINLTICAVIQVVVAVPFLTTYPISYLTKSFELGRVFNFKWTVNFKFLPEDIFVSKPFHLLLLALHLGTLGLLLYKWFLSTKTTPRKVRDSPQTIAIVLFVANFVGVAFARSLHAQFYLWYFHSLPLLLFAFAPGPSPVEALVAFAAIEYAYSYGQPKDRDDPATPFSSMLLQLGHFFILARILLHQSSPQQDYNSIDDDHNHEDKHELASNSTSKAPRSRSSLRRREKKGGK